MAKPVAMEMTSAAMTPMECRNFATGSSTGRPAKKMVCVSGNSPPWLWRKARNAPKRTRKVSTAKADEGPPLEAKGLPEDGSVAERAEPEEVDPIGNGSAAANEDKDDDSDWKIDGKSQAPWF